MTYHQKGSIIMEKTTRITKAMRFEDIKALLNGDTVTHGTTIELALEFIDKEMGLLARKNSGDKKQTALQKENEGYKELILEFLATLPSDSKGATCTEIAKGVPALTDFNNQKISALMRQLKLAERVVADEVKGKTVFRLA